MTRLRMEIRRLSLWGWQTDNLFVYREFDREMNGSPLPPAATDAEEQAD